MWFPYFHQIRLDPFPPFSNQQKWQHSAAPLRKPGVLVIHRKRPKRSTFFPSDVPRSLLEDASKFNGDPNFTDSWRLVATNAKENGQGSKETVVFSVEQVNSWYNLVEFVPTLKCTSEWLKQIISNYSIWMDGMPIANMSKTRRSAMRSCCFVMVIRRLGHGLIGQYAQSLSRGDNDFKWATLSYWLHIVYQAFLNISLTRKHVYIYIQYIHTKSFRYMNKVVNC